MAIVFIRTLMLYLIAILSLRLMGKRQIGELEPSELVVTILISELVTIPMQDLDYPLLYAVVPILALISMEALSSVLMMKSRLFKNFLSGSYNVIIRDGKLDQREMRRAQLTLDELNEELRGHGALSPADVRFCVLETSGKVSVMLKSDCDAHTLPVTVISDGKVLRNNMAEAGLDRQKLRRLLLSHGVRRAKDVFCLSVWDDSVVLIKKEL